MVEVKEFDLATYVRKSAAESSVPTKVKDPAVITQLQALVSGARQSQRSLDRTAILASSASVADKDESQPSQPAA
jgi:hypothetical protein